MWNPPGFHTSLGRGDPCTRYSEKQRAPSGGIASRPHLASTTACPILMRFLEVALCCHVLERMRLPILARYRMTLEVPVQPGMILDVSVIVDQRRILL